MSLVAAAIGTSNEVEFYIGEPDEVVERRETEERLKVQGEVSPYEFLELDSKRLSEYYAINQKQTPAGFRWALIVMLLGFAAVVAGIWLFYLNSDRPDRTLTGLSVAVGLVTDFIAATFIYLNNNTQKLALYYYGRLASLQNLTLSIRIAETQEEAADRAAARNKITPTFRTLVIGRERLRDANVWYRGRWRSQTETCEAVAGHYNLSSE